MKDIALESAPKNTHIASPTSEKNTQASKAFSYISVALGIILLIGSLGAAGYFYSLLGYTSLAIAGLGTICATACFLLAKYLSKSPSDTTFPSEKKEATERKETKSTPEKKEAASEPALLEKALKELRIKKLEDLKNYDLRWMTPEQRALIFNNETLKNQLTPEQINKAIVVLCNEGLVEVPELKKLGVKDFNGLKKLDLIKLSREQRALIVNSELLESELAASQITDDYKRLICNEHLRELPSLTQLGVKDFNQFKLLDLSKLSPEQRAIIFSESLFIESLEDAQIRSCLPLLANEKLISKLSIDQVKKFYDLTNLSEKDFRTIFDDASLLRKLDMGEVYPLIHFFEDKHWDCLSCDQAVDFDFGRFDESERQKLFDALFPLRGAWPKGEERMRKMPLDKIYLLQSFMKDRHWQNLSDEALNKFDIERFEESKRKEVFSQVFARDFLTDRAARLLSKFDLEKIYKLVPYFGEDQWAAVAWNYACEFDPTKIQENVRPLAFSKFFPILDWANESEKKRIAHVHIDKLRVWQPYFSEKHCKVLEEAGITL